MRFGGRRGWLWFLIAWCVVAGLLGAVVTGRPGLAAVMFLAVTLVALEAGLARTRRRRVVTLVTALVMATVFVVAALVATAKPPSGIMLGGNPAVDTFQVNAFELQATSAATLGAVGVAALIVALLLGLQVSRTGALRATGGRAASRWRSAPASTRTGSSSAPPRSRTGRPGSAPSAEPETLPRRVPAVPQAGPERGRGNAPWRGGTGRLPADGEERGDATAGTADAGQTLLRPGPASPGERSPREPASPTPDRTEANARDAAEIADAPIVIFGDPSIDSAAEQAVRPTDRPADETGSGAEPAGEAPAPPHAREDEASDTPTATDEPEPAATEDAPTVIFGDPSIDSAAEQAVRPADRPSDETGSGAEPAGGAPAPPNAREDEASDTPTATDEREPAATEDAPTVIFGDPSIDSAVAEQAVRPTDRPADETGSGAEPAGEAPAPPHASKDEASDTTTAADERDPAATADAPTVIFSDPSIDAAAAEQAVRPTDRAADETGAGAQPAGEAPAPPHASKDEASDTTTAADARDPAATEDAPTVIFGDPSIDFAAEQAVRPTDRAAGETGSGAEPAGEAPAPPHARKDEASDTPTATDERDPAATEDAPTVFFGDPSSDVGVVAPRIRPPDRPSDGRGGSDEPARGAPAQPPNRDEASNAPPADQGPAATEGAPPGVPGDLSIDVPAEQTVPPLDQASNGTRGGEEPAGQAPAAQRSSEAEAFTEPPEDGRGPAPTERAPAGLAGDPSIGAPAEQTVPPPDQTSGEAGGDDQPHRSGPAGDEVDRLTTPLDEWARAQGTSWGGGGWPLAGRFTEGERAMRASLGRLGRIRDDQRPADVRGALDLDRLVCRFGTSGSVGPLSARIRSGELIMVVGDGPASRTEALFRVLHGDRPLVGGQATVGGVNLRHVRSYTVRRLHRVVGFVETIDGRLTPAAALDARLRDVGLRMSGAGRSFRQQDDMVAALRAVGLESRLHTQLADLTLLDQRLVAFAAALVQSPSILLVDEPTAGLERSAERKAVEALLRRLHAADLTVVVGTSDPQLVQRHQGRVVHL